MARLARLVIPGMPHHVTQRGNRRETVFFGDEDYLAYQDMLRESVKASGSALWAWCLMPNHVHMIIVPSHEDGLRQCVANTHPITVTVTETIRFLRMLVPSAFAQNRLSIDFIRLGLGTRCARG